MIGQDAHGPDWRLIARHLSGSASKQEKQWLDVWAAGDPGNERFLGQARLIWNAAGEPGNAAPSPEEVHADWARLKARRAHREAL